MAFAKVIKTTIKMLNANVLVRAKHDGGAGGESKPESVHELIGTVLIGC